MKKAVLDLSGCQYPLEMHRRFQKALLFPDYYGQNWDAFWDCITNDSPVEFVEIRGESKVAPELRSMLDELHNILDEAKQATVQQRCSFDYIIID